MKSFKNICFKILSFTLLLVMFSSQFSQIKLQAAEKASINGITPSVKSLNLKSGETKTIKISKRTYKKNKDLIQYWYTSNYEVAEVNEKGVVTAKLAGTAMITCEEYLITDSSDFWGYSYSFKGSFSIPVTVKKSSYTLPKKELNISQEKYVSLKIPTASNVIWNTSYTDYENMGSANISIENNKTLKIYGTKQGSLYLTVSWYNEKNKLLGVDRILINVAPLGLSETDLTIAKNCTYKFKVYGYEDDKIISWKSSDKSIATISKSGKLTAKKSGFTEITLTVDISDMIDENPDDYYYYEDNKTRTFTCYITVTDPKLTQKSQNLAVGVYDTINFTGTDYTSNISLTSNNSSVLAIEGGNIKGLKKGTAKVSANVDGRKFTYTVRVTNPTVKASIIPLKKGSKSEIKISGTNKYSKVEYKTSDKSKVSITADGKIKAKDFGCSQITIMVDKKEIDVIVPVAEKKIVKAIEYGTSVIGSTYSQDKRMSKGYYDCSSFVWRSYHAAGVNIGSKTYAPTAADNAKYCVDNGAAITQKVKSAKDLKPGDLFYFSGSNNGRYKNIYHTAMFIGAVDVNTEWYSYTRLYFLEAIGAGVCLTSSYDISSASVISRPTLYY